MLISSERLTTLEGKSGISREINFLGVGGHNTEFSLLPSCFETLDMRTTFLM
jgi:hypothetical protein